MFFFFEILENYHHAAQPEWQEKHPCVVSWHLFIFHPQDKQFPSWQWHFSMSEYQRYFAASLHFTCLFVESATVVVFVNVKAKIYFLLSKKERDVEINDCVS